MRIRRHSEWNYILIIVWIIIVLVSSIFTYNTVKLLVNGTKTVWVVTKVNANHSDDWTSYSLTAKYDCWSKKWVVWNSMWSSSSYNYNIWKQIEIYCNEQDPETFLPKHFTNYLTFLFPIMWFIALWFWIKNVVEQNKRKKLKKELMQFGIKVEAIVMDIKQTLAAVNHQHWYIITTQYWEDTFVSETIFADIYKILKQWDKIDVYLDSGDHSRYWMDTDSIFDRDYDNTMIVN